MVECVRQRKEENPLIVSKSHCRPACLHLETEGSNTGPVGGVFPPLCENWFREQWEGVWQVQNPERDLWS